VLFAERKHDKSNQKPNRKRSDHAPEPEREGSGLTRSPKALLAGALTPERPIGVVADAGDLIPG
jgi:hypothetical protein